MSKIIDLTGHRFGRLVVVRQATTTYARGGAVQIRWWCRCDCGTELSVMRGALRSGHTQSCGCFFLDVCRKRTLSHGETRYGRCGSPEYRSWAEMVARCENRRKQNWRYYGGRGITVCQRWRESFEAFLADMGRKPSSVHSIDRYPNNDGNYEPGNCRWATQSEQLKNRRPFRRRPFARQP